MVTLFARQLGNITKVIVTEYKYLVIATLDILWSQDNLRLCVEQLCLLFEVGHCPHLGRWWVVFLVCYSANVYLFSVINILATFQLQYSAYTVLTSKGTTHPTYLSHTGYNNTYMISWLLYSLGLKVFFKWFISTSRLSSSHMVLACWMKMISTTHFWDEWCS
jgi:hypothetical protein